MWPLAERSLRIPFFFLLLTGVPLAALVWLGWHFLQLDRDLERRRQRERLENASELLARDLHDQLQALMEALPEPDRSRLAVPTDGVFFQLRGGEIDIALAPVGELGRIELKGDSWKDELFDFDNLRDLLDNDAFFRDLDHFDNLAHGFLRHRSRRRCCRSA